jgi:hypothetical protein
MILRREKVSINRLKTTKEREREREREENGECSEEHCYYYEGETQKCLLL